MTKETVKDLKNEYNKLKRKFLSKNFDKLSFEDKHKIVEKLSALDKLELLFKDDFNA